MFFVLPYGVDRPLYRRPSATYVFLAINAVVFALQFLLIPLTAAGGREKVVDDFIKLFGFSSVAARPWTLVAHQFVHGGWFHFLWNMYFLYLVGAMLEDRVGRVRMVFLYLAGGCAGALLQKGLMNDAIPLVGASGAIAALMGAFFVAMPWCDFKVFYFFWPFFRLYSGTTKTPAVFFLGFYFFLGNLWDALAARSGAAGVSVAYWCHVGGFVFGALVAAFSYGLRAFAHSDAELQLEEARVQLALSRAVREQEAGAPRARSRDLPDEADPASEPSPVVLEQAIAAGSVQRAGKEFRRLLQRNPSFSLPPVMQFALGELLIEAGMKDFALIALDNLVNAHPRSVQAQAGFLMAGKLAGENPVTRPRALTYLERFLRTNPAKEERAEAERLMEELSRSLSELDVGDFTPDIQKEAPNLTELSSALPALASVENADRDANAIDLDVQEPPAPRAAPLFAEPSAEDAALRFAPEEPDESHTRTPLHIHLGIPKETAPQAKGSAPFSESPVRAISLGEILRERRPPFSPESTRENAPEEETEKIVRSGPGKAAPSIDERDSAHITDTAILRLPNQDRKRRVSSPDASCSLIVAPRREIDFERLLAELSSVLDRPCEVLAERLRLQCGILMHDVPYSAGVEIRDRLLKAGLPIRLVENRKSIDFASSVEAVGLEVRPDRLVWRTRSADLEMTPRAIALLACGQVRISPDSLHHSVAVDLFQMRPVLHVRLWEGSFSFADAKGIEDLRPPGQDLADPQALRRLAHYLAQLSHETVQTYAVREWLAPDGPAEPRVFRHIGSYDDYNRWHILAYFAAETE